MPRAFLVKGLTKQDFDGSLSHVTLGSAEGELFLLLFVFKDVSG